MLPSQWTSRAGSVLLVGTGLFVFLCIVSYDPADVSILSSSPNENPANLGGALGVWIAFVGRAGFGWASLLLPILCFLWAWRYWFGLAPKLHVFSILLASVCLMASSGTLLAINKSTELYQTESGGVVGYLLASSGSHYLGKIGTVIAGSAVALLSWFIVSGQALSPIRLNTFRSFASALSSLINRFLPGRPVSPSSVNANSRRSPTIRLHADAAVDESMRKSESRPHEESVQSFSASSPPKIRVRSTVEPKPKIIPTPRKLNQGGFQLPPLDLLVSPPPVSERRLTSDLQVNAKILEETLKEFGIEATVVNIDRGPTVTRYELAPAPGVKITSIVSLADDLALVMKAANCNIVAPIPGKGRVGIDVPNLSATTVYLKEIISSHQFAAHSSPIALPIGKDVSGQPVVADLRDCPHLLIAGATGSGKTVCLNSLLVGILSRSTPEQVQFLMIDPKMVELSVFNGIPHLIGPVVTNPKKAAAALQWAVQEMERRYKLLARAGVRSLALYNKRIASNTAPSPQKSNDIAEEDEDLQDDGRPMPYLVIVIDELADLMMAASQDVENAITRLAQLSRAVGIHVILATQRPSVDVITGVIKANFPARIAFQVASKVDSRTILDVNGADKLLGRGDLLFLQPGTAKPIRVQGALVADSEIEQITNFIKSQREPDYNQRLLEHHRKPESALDMEKDELYEMAKQVILNAGQASTSLLQRRLRVGYGRAARILDLMEQEGLIGPPQGSRAREVLVSPDVVQT